MRSAWSHYKGVKGNDYRVVDETRRLRSLTLVGASDESQVFFVQEVLKSWFSAV